MKRKKKTEYAAKDIKVLHDLEGVRKRPAMYIGDTGIRGLHHLIFELIDNAIDEALAGYANEIKVILHKDNSVSVCDNGRGIPVDIHPEMKKSALEVIFTKLHAGGKFDTKVYKISGGLHGVGASVVNALSKWLEVIVWRDHKEYSMRFERGKPVSKLKKKSIKTNKHGTCVRFSPDPLIFPDHKFQAKVITKKLKELSYLIPVKIIFKNETVGKKQKRTFFHPEGLIEYIIQLAGDKRLHEPFYVETERDGVLVEITVCYNNSYNENILTYVNTINTHEGGTHLSGFKSGLLKAINAVAKKMNMDKFQFVYDDVKEGLNAIIHVRLPQPQFEGQTKMKLGNSEVKWIVQSIVYNQFSEYLFRYPDIAKKILNKIKLAAKSREAARKAKELTRKSFLKSVLLPTKLADCSSKDKNKRELFIVEGESAAGSAKLARDSKTQAVLPLKGKIINAIRASSHKVLNNEEVKTLIQSIGAGWGKDFNIDKVRYGKIIISTDADSDGNHITVLLLSFFYKYMKPLIENGKVYVAMTPLYKVVNRNKVYYFYNDKELDNYLKRLKNKNHIIIQRFKGLGEMNPDTLREVMMDPATRKLKKITIENAKEADEIVKILMGSNVEKRRNFITKYAKYANLDI